MVKHASSAGVIRETRRDQVFLAVLLVISAFILVIELYPLIFVVSASFSDSDAISLGRVYLLPVNPSLDGYWMLLKEKDILTGFKNSVIYLAVGTTVNMLLTMLLLARGVTWLLRTHYAVTFHGILGIVAASTLVIVPIRYDSVSEAVASLLCCAAGFLLAFFLEKLDRALPRA